MCATKQYKQHNGMRRVRDDKYTGQEAFQRRNQLSTDLKMREDWTTWPSGEGVLQDRAPQEQGLWSKDVSAWTRVSRVRVTGMGILLDTVRGSQRSLHIMKDYKPLSGHRLLFSVRWVVMGRMWFDLSVNRITVRNRLKDVKTEAVRPVMGLLPQSTWERGRLMWRCWQWWWWKRVRFWEYFEGQDNKIADELKMDCEGKKYGICQRWLWGINPSDQEGSPVFPRVGRMRGWGVKIARQTSLRKTARYPLKNNSIV